MHFVRVARKSPKRSIPTRHYTVEQKKHDLHKKDVSTTITYKGQHFTPVGFAGHVALQVTAKGMNLFKELIHIEDVQCACIKPYLILPVDKERTNSELKWLYQKYAISNLQLEYAIEQYKDSPSEIIKLQMLQKTLCPNLNQCREKCCNQFSRERFKVGVSIGTRGVLLSLVPPAIGAILVNPEFAGVPFIFFSIPGLTFSLVSALLPVLQEKSERKSAALAKYIEYKTTEINSVLEEVVTKAPLKNIALPEIKYLSAPQKTDSQV